MKVTHEAVEKNNEKLIYILALTLVFSGMNATIFNVVLPVISKQFTLSTSQVSWIVTSYVVVYAFGSLTFGKLADRYRLKDLMTFGLSVFALGSVIGLAATSFWMIILGRVVQASGASIIPTAAMIIPVRYFPPESRGKALGTSAVGIALGGAFGPIVSGFVTDIGSWRLLFGLSLLPLITLPLYRKYLNDERGKGSHIDLLGGTLLAGTVLLLLLAITQGEWKLFVTSAILIGLFILRIRSAAEPFIQPQLFHNKRYVFALVIAFVIAFLNLAIPFTAPQFLDNVNHLSPAAIGLVMFPGAIAAALMGRRGGKLADDKGNWFLVCSSVPLTLISFALLSSLIGVRAWIIAVMIIFGYVGQTFMQIAVSNTISRTLSKDQVGVGMGMYTMLNFISGATAISLIGKALDFHTTTVRFNPLSTMKSAYIYSNVFFVLFLVALTFLALYYLWFVKCTRRGRFDYAPTND